MRARPRTPFDFLIGPDDRATVEGLTGFVKTATRSSTTALRRRLRPSWEYIGSINYFRCVKCGMPRYWGVGYKSYGNLSQRNPLRVRLKRQDGLAILACADPLAEARSIRCKT